MTSANWPPQDTTPLDPSVTFAERAVPDVTNHKARPVSEFAFSGTGSGYFGIWIVNLLLTIVTLGLYSPWAKVRRLRYFYGHTHVGDARVSDNFDFTGNPVSILKGRLIAVAFYALLLLGGYVHEWATAIALLLLYLALPWLLRATYRFRARNSLHRNRRFYFSGTSKEAAKTYLLWPFLAIISLGLLAPLAFYKHKQYQFNHLSIGQVGFTLKATAGAFYKAVLLLLGIYLVIGVMIGITIGGIGMSGLGEPVFMSIIGIIIAFYLFSFAITFWFTGHMYRLVWNTVYLNNSPFTCDLSVGRYVFVAVTNVLMIVFTLGFATPWAKVRMHRLKVESLYVQWQDDISELAQVSQLAPSALGEEVADVFDIDVSL